MGFPEKRIVASVVLSALAVAASGCELVATVDRSLIDPGDAGVPAASSAASSAASTTTSGSGTGGAAGAGGAGGSGGAGASSSDGGAGGAGGSAGMGGSASTGVGGSGGAGGSAGMGGSASTGVGGSGGTGVGGTGGTGGSASTGVGGSGGTGGGGTACTSPQDCPGQDTDCQSRACTNNQCGIVFAPAGTLTSMQTAGDCKATQCDGAGNAVTVPDDNDLPDDGNECTDDLCMAGNASHSFLTAGSPCAQSGGKLCDGSGNCVECLTGADCQSQVCLANACQLPTCMDMVQNGTETDVDCGGIVCTACMDGMGCDVGTDCTSGVCTGNICQAPTCSDGVMNQGETGIDCGGPCAYCPVLLLLAGGTQSPDGVLASAFDPVAGSWASLSLAGRTVDGIAIALTSSGQGIGLMRFTEIGHPSDNELQFTTWTSGVWAPFAAVGPTVTTQGPPAIDALGTGAQAVFHGFDYNHYYAAYQSGIWSPPAEPTGSSGAVAGDIATLGADAAFVYLRGLENDLYARDRTFGWQPEQLIATDPQFDIPPEVVALTAGPQLMAVYVSENGGQIRFATRASGVWSAPLPIANALTTARPSLAALTGGGAVLAFRGLDGHLYACLYDGAAWSSPEQVTMDISAAPAAARGIGSATVELAFLAGGEAFHTRRIAGTWTSPAPVGGASLASVALAAGP